MPKDDLQTGRETPPRDDEWPMIWRRLERANSLVEKMWVVVGPIHAVVTNWKALCVIGTIVAYFKSDAIIALAINLMAGKI